MPINLFSNHFSNKDAVDKSLIIVQAPITGKCLPMFYLSKVWLFRPNCLSNLSSETPPFSILPLCFQILFRKFFDIVPNQLILEIINWDNPCGMPCEGPALTRKKEIRPNSIFCYCKFPVREVKHLPVEALVRWWDFYQLHLYLKNDLKISW